MKPLDAEDRFRERITASVGPPAALTPSAGIEPMLCFYRDERAEGCPFEGDGDMLLYQWGAYDWGEGTSFELDITRQFIIPGDEDVVEQLALTFRFPPASVPDGLGAGNRWCRTPEGLPELREFIEGSPGYIAVGRAQAKSVSLTFGGV